MKPARFARHRVGKGHGLGQQLQGPGDIISRGIGDRRVHPVVQNRQTQGIHVHAQLVLLAGDRAQRVPGQTAAHVQHLNARFAVGHASHFLLAEKRRALRDTGLADDGKSQAAPPRGNGLVAFLNRVLPEQHLVGVAVCRLHGKHHQPGGFAVNAVQRHQGVELQAVLEPDQQRFLQVMTGRGDGQKVRLVGHHQMRVLKNNGFFKRYAGLCGQGAVVINADVALVGALRCHRLAQRVHHQVGSHAAYPFTAGNGWETFDQEIGDGGPGAQRGRGQADAAGPHAVTGGQGGSGGAGHAVGLSCAAVPSGAAGLADATGLARAALRRVNTTSHTPWPSLMPRFSNLVRGR